MNVMRRHRSLGRRHDRGIKSFGARLPYSLFLFLKQQCYLFVVLMMQLDPVCNNDDVWLLQFVIIQLSSATSRLHFVSPIVQRQ